jgi:DNA repair exonuclease SbcCD nuclease subunit
LGYRQYNLDERESDFYEVFNEAVDAILKEDVDIVIHSGDLFDSPLPPIKALKTFRDSLKRISDKAKFISVLGDHDMPRRRGLYPHSLFDNVKVLGLGCLEQMDFNGLLIAGISNLRGRSIELLREEIKKFDKISSGYRKSIFIMHQAIDRYLPFEGAYEVREDELPRTASYYALGHIHSRILTKFGKGILAYAGSTEINSRSDIPSWRKDGKGFFLVDLDGDEPKVQKVDLNVRPQIDLELNVMDRGELSNALKVLNENLTSISKLSKKLPIIHLNIKCRDVERQSIMNKINDAIKGRILTSRISFVEETSLPSITAIKGGVDQKGLIGEILKKYGLSNEKFINLALELQDLLVNDEIDEAVNLVKKFFGVDAK